LRAKTADGRERLTVDKITDTTCPYCGCGCNITLHTHENQIVKITSDPQNHNQGWLCVKGRFGHDFINSPDRLKTPLIRKEKGGELEPASWDEALGLIADRLSSIKEEHGSDAIGGLSSARCTNEENYAFQKFFRAKIGTNNIDHCARY
jgi:predicted molibdopterin-dependent oxidoreductase YjgC